MSGWKSTKSGKHFQTRTKPGISSGNNNHSHSGSQASPIHPSQQNKRDSSLFEKEIWQIGMDSRAYKMHVIEIRNEIEKRLLRDFRFEDDTFRRREDGKIERKINKYDDFPADKAVNGEYSDKVEIISDEEYIRRQHEYIEEEVDHIMELMIKIHADNVRDMLVRSRNKPYEFIFGSDNNYAIMAKDTNVVDAEKKAQKILSKRTPSEKKQIGRLTGLYNINTDDHEAPVGNFPYAV